MSIRSFIGQGRGEVSLAAQKGNANSSATSLQSRRGAKDLVWVVAGQGAAALGAVVGVRIVTRAFPPSSYGESALLMTVAALGLQIILLPLGGGVLRFFAPAQQEHQVKAFTRAGVRVLGWASLGVTLLAVVAAFVAWATGAGSWITGLACLLSYALAFGWSAALESVQNAAQQRAVVALHQGVVQWLRPLLAVALIPILGSSGKVILIGWALASLLVLVSQLLFARPLLQQHGSRPEACRAADVRRWSSTIVSYALPQMFWGVFTWAQLGSDRWALETFRSRFDVGLYAAVYQLGYLPMILLSTVATQFAAPIVFSMAGDGSDPARVAAACKFNERLPLLFLAVTALLTGIVFLVRRLIGTLFLGTAYQGASYLLPWMVVAGGVFGASQITAISVFGTGQTRRLLAPKVTTALLGILLVALGAWQFALPGVVAGQIAFSCSCYVWNFLLLRRYRSEFCP